MDIPSSRQGAAHRCTSVPSDSGRGSFTLELIRDDRIALRVGKVAVYFTTSEARRILAALSAVLGVDLQPLVRL